MQIQNRQILGLFIALLMMCSFAAAQPTRPATTQASWDINPDLPTIFLAGDSTAQVGDPLHTGWGKSFGDFVDRSKANWVNAARGGRSSRTYITEGIWDRVLSAMKPGDLVFIQFGHNDAGAINDNSRARGSIRGLGEETQEIDNQLTGKHEVVHTYGWYMKKMVEDAKAKGATPILLGITVRNVWKDGKVERNNGQWTEWTKQIAQDEHVAFIDLTDMIADRYDGMGPDEVKRFFPADHTHTSPDGAALNAQLVLAGVKALHRQNILKLLSPAARSVDPATQPSVILPRVNRPTTGASAIDQANFLNWPTPGNTSLPSIFLIGDSTVRNGRGDGSNGQWGWGDALAAYIDPNKANLVNRALGGTGARTYMHEWPDVLAMVKKGDIVIMQFGTNDNGERGALPGVGDDTKPAGDETVHTFGWYLRKYIADVRGRGATPIVCTLVPRNIWKDGKTVRPTGSHADWARQVAKDQNVPLLDLYEGAAKRYDNLGQDKTTALFADQRVHTNHDGAEVLASVVIQQLKELPENPAAAYLREKPAATW
jgi:lysophospholipase L1-like esterase